MKYFTKKIIAVLLTVMLTGITVLHVSGGQTIKVNAAQTFKVHFIDVGAADGALLQYGEGENAKYALIDSGAYSYETTDHDTIDVSDRVHQYLLDHGVKHLEFVVLTHPHGDHIGGMKKILEDKNITIDTIYGNPLEFEYLESSEDKEKQTEEVVNTKVDLKKSEKSEKSMPEKAVPEKPKKSVNKGIDLDMIKGRDKEEASLDYDEFASMDVNPAQLAQDLVNDVYDDVY